MTRIGASFIGILALGLGVVPAAAEPGARFDRFDLNGDGYIDGAEIEEAAFRRFDRLDANRDGVLDFAELAAMRGRGQASVQGGGQNGGNVERRFARIDRDGNGVIAPNEFVAQPLRMLTRIDSDGNGAIDRVEMKAAVDRRRANRLERRGGAGQ